MLVVAIVKRQYLQKLGSQLTEINNNLKMMDKAGTINATRNRHRVASFLAKLSLSEKDKQLIFQHFGQSKSINEHVYQAGFYAACIDRKTFKERN